MRVLFVAILFVALCASLVKSADAKGENKKRKSAKNSKQSASRASSLEAEEKAETQWASLPDYTAPATMETLTCNACVATAYEIHNSLSLVNSFRHDSGSPYELFEILEGTCRRMEGEYGLFFEPKTAPITGEEGSVDDGTVLEFRSSKRFPDVLTGRWVTPFLTNRCGRIIDRHEKKIMNNYKSMAMEDFTRTLCIEWDKSCPRGAVPAAEEEQQQPSEEERRRMAEEAAARAKAEALAKARADEFEEIPDGEEELEE